jgi:CHASE3 domain sensor protein
MNQMSLKKKLIGGFALVALITLVVGTIGWRGVSATGSALIEVGEDHLQVMDLAKSGKREEAMAFSTGKARASFAAAEKLLGEIIELQNRQSGTFIKESIGDVNRPKIIMGIGMGVSTLAALFLGIFLSLSISQALTRISTGMAQGAEQVASASGQVASLNGAWDRRHTLFRPFGG